MLVAENITKRFGGITALENVNMELQTGKVNAILGENGAGKSTLMKILSGVYPEYEGRILLNGKQVSFSNPREAQHAGIAIIHQELNLVPYLTITENIFLGRELETSWGVLNRKEMYRRTEGLLKRLKLAVSPDALVSHLKVGQQQVIEIAKALLTDCQVIIMDEPTSAITESEVEVLFTIINELKQENKTIVYISHKLDELFKIADNYIVLRDGRTIESGKMCDVNHDLLIRKMVGREIRITKKENCGKQRPPLLTVRDVYVKHPSQRDALMIKNVSFQLCKGEVIGIFGLMGAGRTELMETIFGLHKYAGNISLDGKDCHFKTPADALKAGFALVPEDRKKDGLILDQCIRHNMSLTVLDKVETGGFLHEKKEHSLADGYIQSLRIKTPSSEQAVKNLSGGNQQKVVLAKYLATQPKVLMLDEPTRGIDINAKNEIYKLIESQAEAGLGVIVVSSEVPEILAVSDRILVMAEGRITAELSIEEANEDKILKAAIPQSL
jgi:ribose transport system ATP-binding protein